MEVGGCVSGTVAEVRVQSERKQQTRSSERRKGTVAEIRLRVRWWLFSFLWVNNEFAFDFSFSSTERWILSCQYLMNFFLRLYFQQDSALFFINRVFFFRAVLLISLTHVSSAVIYEVFSPIRQVRCLKATFNTCLFSYSEFLRFPVSLVLRKRKAREAVISAYCSARTAGQFLASTWAPELVTWNQ